jgi:hypothetical protein
MSIFCENTNIFWQFRIKIGLASLTYVRIKYPDEKKCINDITPFMVLLKNQGAYTE